MDDNATTKNGNLRDGVIDLLIRAAERAGLKLSEREIQRRVQCARTYSTEDQIRKIIADFEMWFDVAEARFPHVPAPENAVPHDPGR